MITLIDTHAHLDHVENIEDALKDAVAAGVSAVLAVSTDLAAMKRNIEIRERCGAKIRIFLGLGIHPGEIKPDELDESYDFIEKNIHSADVVGEIGLDFWYKWVRKDDEKKSLQREVFQRQLLIAKRHHKPVVVHTRGTWKESLQTVRDVGIGSANFHWYSGPVDVLEEIVKSGYYVSCGPALAFSPQSRLAIAAAPKDSVLLETDSPVYFNYPEDLGGGFRAAPKDVFKSLNAYATLKGIALDEAAKIANANASRFLGAQIL